jgi:radical SAM protein with 4Fe4S-binding SPASM domain
MSHHTLEQSI